MKSKRYLVLSYGALALIYHATVFRFISVSAMAQALSIVLTFFFAAHRRFSIPVFLISVFSLTFFIFQAQHALAFVIIILLYVISSRVELIQISRSYIGFVIILSTLSVMHFYGGMSFLYDPVYFSNYFLGGTSRLIGLDRSPAILGFLVGLAMILSLQIKKTSFKFLAISFLFIVLVATASRTAVSGLLLSLLFARCSGSLFSIWIFCLILTPFVLVWVYFKMFGDLSYMVLIEAVSSNRIINWINLLHFFFQKDLLSILFGIGKPPVIEHPFIVDSFTGEYSYRYVTYAESSILKILTYHGLIVFIISLYFLLYRSWNAHDYMNRSTISYIIFGAIYYDGVISVQYAIVTLVLFSALRLPRFQKRQKAHLT